MEQRKEFIEAGKIINTHGVHGEVKIEVWLDSAEYLKSFPRVFIRGREVKLLSSFVQKNFLIAKLEGVEDVNQAMALKETVIAVARADAKLPEGGYFLSDILGFDVLDEDGNKIGVLKEIFESPASMVYVVQGETEHLIPGRSEFILKADLTAGTLTVRLLEGM